MEVSGYCCGGAYSEPIRSDATLELTKSIGCLNSKRAMFTVSVVGIPGTWVPAVHAVCEHNEYVALVKRTLGSTPEPVDAGMAHLRAAFRKLRRVAGRYSGSRWTYLETAQSYKGAMRRRYEEAERSLSMEGPICSRDSFIKAFLKAEKRKPWDVQKPRMIFPRSPRYNLHLASWLKPFEHWLWGNLKSRGISAVGNTRVCAKGLGPVQRANLIVRKMSGLKDCVVFEVDGKAFEAHILVDQLRLEHSVYTTAYPAVSDLSRTLSQQLGNRGKTKCGWEFSREGGRASGDYNTGMGNSLIMLAIVMASMSYLGHRMWDTLVDGDNALVFLPGDDYQRVRDGFADAARFVSGHTMVLERCVKKPEQVTFGQSRPLCVSRGWKMVRDWRKVLSQSTSDHANLREPRFSPEYIAGVARCEASLAHEVPILWAWTNHLLALTKSVSNVRQHVLRDYEVLGVDVAHVTAHPAAAAAPGVMARASFAEAYGIMPDEQLLIESLLEKASLCVEGRDLWDRDFQLAWSADIRARTHSPTSRLY